MRVTILGSGTLLPDHRRNSAGHCVQTGGATILLDCGAGVLQGLHRYLRWQDVTHIALSHFHTDHVGDLPPLLFALCHGLEKEREEPLWILGPPGLSTLLDRLAEAYGEYVLEPGFPLRLREIPRDGSWSDPGGRFRLYTHPTIHTDESVAYRLESGDGVMGYTGDTGPSTTLAEFLTGVGLLIAECSIPDPPEIATHLSPDGVAEMARIAGPDLLVTTHASPPLDPERVPELILQAGHRGTTVAGRDGMSFSVEGSRATFQA
ncbi:MAG: ribonuclease Z [Gemmatimonadetes bacterium]|nr:ribonuclease Z [Gemmatimonadota bacterium]